MGRYDFRPARVLRSVTTLLETKSIPRPPPWFDVVQNIPPPSSQTLVRVPKGKKRSQMFKPLPITYAEDRLRSEFFGDHPWELARPKVVLEDSGNDSQNWDWSRLKQPGKRVDGERYAQCRPAPIPNVETLGSS
jgi:small subunit ribosomal protein S23